MRNLKKQEDRNAIEVIRDSPSDRRFVRDNANSTEPEEDIGSELAEFPRSECKRDR